MKMLEGTIWGVSRKVMLIVVILSLCIGISYGRIDRGVDPETVVKHVDVCVKWQRFRYVYQGSRLVTMFQVFQEKNGVSVPADCNFGKDVKPKDEEKEEVLDEQIIQR